MLNIQDFIDAGACAHGVLMIVESTGKIQLPVDVLLKISSECREWAKRCLSGCGGHSDYYNVYGYGGDMFGDGYGWGHSYGNCKGCCTGNGYGNGKTYGDGHSYGNGDGNGYGYSSYSNYTGNGHGYGGGVN